MVANRYDVASVFFGIMSCFYVNEAVKVPRIVTLDHPLQPGKVGNVDGVELTVIVRQTGDYYIDVVVLCVSNVLVTLHGKVPYL